MVNKKQTEFEKWFYRVVDGYLLQSLENWQIERMKDMAFKAYYKKPK